MTLDPSTIKQRLAEAIAKPQPRNRVSMSDWNRAIAKEYICKVRGCHSCLLPLDTQEAICMKEGFCECVCGARCSTSSNKWTEYEPR